MSHIRYHGVLLWNHVTVDGLSVVTYFWYIQCSRFKKVYTWFSICTVCSPYLVVLHA